MIRLQYFFGYVYCLLFLPCLGITLASQNDEEHGEMSLQRAKVELTTSTLQPDVALGLKNRVRESQCPSNIECSKLGDPCISCTFNETCIYGGKTNGTCKALVNDCLGPKEFEMEIICRYCYQTDHWEHSCVQKAGCSSVVSPRGYYRSNCTVKPEVQCLGRRTFLKNLKCNWTGGYRWSTALILSVTLGGFGADRFYLGHWQEGIGKLFSFGGLGVWTLIDVVLIAIHYLGPADGSLYI
ncbi:TM2 domain-containing protein almondex [Macrosteles quadrilineatus]|uniref:TM2 domain-containing protein almondex n=1 Tax=Macrosteles quadrilineatus TaxID=74068 RepID=UPI0023E2B2E2|nr:TM2 domain-containing protein almondex [Macrosteles quadrilineatus]